MPTSATIACGARPRGLGTVASPGGATPQPRGCDPGVAAGESGIRVASLAGMAKSANPKPDLRVRDLMHGEVATLRRNDKLVIADDVMRLGRIRHLPVVEDDDETAVVGVVSQRDLFRGALTSAFGYGEVARRRVMHTISVKEVMSSPVITIAPDVALAEAATLMLKKKVGCLPVVEGEKLVGILTESDFVALFAKR